MSLYSPKKNKNKERTNVSENDKIFECRQHYSTFFGFYIRKCSVCHLIFNYAQQNFTRSYEAPSVHQNLHVIFVSYKAPICEFIKLANFGEHLAPFGRQVFAKMFTSFFWVMTCQFLDLFKSAKLGKFWWIFGAFRALSVHQNVYVVLSYEVHFVTMRHALTLSEHKSPIVFVNTNSTCRFWQCLLLQI